jgi:hypothetical protein
MALWTALPYLLFGIASCLAAVRRHRFVRAIAWNVYLRMIGVDAVKRRQLAMKAAELDFRVDSADPPTEPAAVISLPTSHPEPDQLTKSGLTSTMHDHRVHPA